MDPGRGWRTLGVERQRREELRRLARGGRMLEAGRELDQGRFAERGAHEGNADRNPKREAHRHVDDRVADDGRGCRAAEDKVIAIDQVSGPGGRIGGATSASRWFWLSSKSMPSVAPKRVS